MAEAWLPRPTLAAMDTERSAMAKARRLGTPQWTALLIGAGVFALGLGLVVALLAELQDEFGFPTWGLGLIAGISFVAGFAGNVTLGPVADRGHARTMLVASMVGGVAALLWLSVATELWSFIAARAVFGLADGAFFPAARRIAVTGRPDRPGAQLGALMGAALAGFLSGPLLGGLLAEGFGLRMAFIAPAVVLALTTPVVSRRLPRVVAPGQRQAVLTLLRRPIIRAAILLASSEFFIIGGLEAIWARLITDRGASTAGAGLTLTIVILPMVVLAPAVGRLADRIEPTRIALTATFLLAAVTPLIGLVNTVALTVLVGLGQSVINSATAPSSQAMAARASPATQLAAGQGLLDGIGLLAAGAAALPIGWFYGEFGPRWIGVFLALPVLVFWVLALIEVRRAKALHRVG